MLVTLIYAIRDIFAAVGIAYVGSLIIATALIARRKRKPERKNSLWVDQEGLYQFPNPQYDENSYS
jgi:hypothetical protein